MSTAEEPIPKRSDERKIARLVALRYSGHEAAGLESAIRSRRMAEKIASMAATGEVGPLTFTPEEEAEMALAIGNETHYHTNNYYPAPPAIEAPKPADTTPVATPDPIKPEVIHPEIVKPEIVQPVFAPVGSSNGKLLPLMMLLGVLGVGGLGATALSLWNSRNQTTINNPVPVDVQDWKLGLEITDKP